VQVTKYVGIAVAGLGVLALFLGIRAWNTLRKPIPPLVSPQRVLSPEERQLILHLRTASVSDEVRVHLLDGEFKIVQSMDAIPRSCTSAFESSFVTRSGDHALPGEITIANPGEPFQASDYISVRGLPFRRLAFAGLGASKCFLYYQSGGGPPSFCLAVVDYASQKTVWAGEYHEAVKSVDDLRRMMTERLFRNASTGGC
jgi:hypothetical protein